jgi:carbon-monoxide dehydrogenase large subunit
LRDERLLFPDVGTNVVQRFASGSQADFGGCEVVVEERIVNQRLTAAPIEGRSAAAYWTDDGRLVHYAACQGAHPTRDLLAAVYGLDPSRVRVLVPDVGGGFGAKSRSTAGVRSSTPGWAARATDASPPTSWMSCRTPGRTRSSAPACRR